MSQQRTNPEMCRNHSQRQAMYFLQGQPWMKFCSECALNSALYGKKISKDYSADQLKNKKKLNTWLKQIQSSLSQISMNRKQIDQFLNQIEANYIQPFTTQIKKVQQYCEQVLELNKQLKNIFHELFETKLSCFHERQTKILLNEITLKKQIQEIEGCTENLIDKAGQAILDGKIQQWEGMLEQNRGLLIGRDEMEEFKACVRSGQGRMDKRIREIKGKAEEINCGVLLKVGKQNKGMYTQSDILTSKTRLKLRSQSKTNSAKKDRHSISGVRKSIRDQGNISTILSSFQY